MEKEKGYVWTLRTKISHYRTKQILVTPRDILLIFKISGMALCDSEPSGGSLQLLEDNVRRILTQDLLSVHFGDFSQIWRERNEYFIEIKIC